MPALQVRDFPDDLYEQLKTYAASQHRSVAQQTIVAVEQMLAHQDASHFWDGERLYRTPATPRLRHRSPASRPHREAQGAV